MNTELLLSIKESILRDAKAFDMAQGTSVDLKEEKREEHPCFTQACIAGWAVFKTLGKVESRFWFGGDDDDDNEDIGIYKIARDALELTDEQANRLFYLKAHAISYDVDDYWPDFFQSALLPTYIYEKGSEQWEDAVKHNAEIAGKRIDHFIATGGAE